MMMPIEIAIEETVVRHDLVVVTTRATDPHLLSPFAVFELDEATHAASPSSRFASEGAARFAHQQLVRRLRAEAGLKARRRGHRDHRSRDHQKDHHAGAIVMTARLGTNSRNGGRPFVTVSVPNSSRYAAHIANFVSEAEPLQAHAELVRADRVRRGWR